MPTPPAVSISDDDDIWIVPLKAATQADLLTNIQGLLFNPEKLLNNLVDKKAIYRHLAGNLDALDRDRKIDYVFSELDTEPGQASSLKRVEDHTKGKDKAERNRIWREWLSRRPIPRLFLKNTPVLVQFQYGPFGPLPFGKLKAPAPPKIGPYDILVQGEYGTNAIRVWCPIWKDNPAISLNLRGRIQLTLTEYNVAYLHFDLEDPAVFASLYRNLAICCAFPQSMARFINERWGNPDNREIVFSDTLMASIPPGDPPPLEALTKACEHMVFSIPGLSTIPDRGGPKPPVSTVPLRYELIFQTLPPLEAERNEAKFGMGPKLRIQPQSSPPPTGGQANTSATPSSCIKIVSSGQILYDASGNAYILVQGEGGQMIRWYIPPV